MTCQDLRRFAISLRPAWRGTLQVRGAGEGI
jgi:hypothetical protein